MDSRKIIHVDMDAFYASVEQRDNKELKGKPVIVGGDPTQRGVVSACSYEARRFGIHSAMASKTAYRLCPQAVFIRPRFDAYKEASYLIREVFFEYTDLVEPLSLDEAFLDVTHNKNGIQSATEIAREIKKKIKENTDLTASAGVSYNKFLAKIASDFDKPDGLTVVTPERAREFIDTLAIKKFFGIGKATEKKFLDMGIKTGLQLRQLEKDVLQKIFGKAGEYYYYIARGIDNREVNPERIRKSMSCEITLQKDTTDKNIISDVIDNLSLRLEKMMDRHDRRGKTITLKVKYHDFSSITRSITADKYIEDRKTVLAYIEELLPKTDVYSKEVRLLGMGISNFEGDDDDKEQDDEQLQFAFDIKSFPKNA